MLVASNVQEVTRQLRQTENATRTATRRALNKIGQQGLTLTLRSLAKATGVTVRKLREYVSLDRANYSELSSAIKVIAHTFNIASVGTARQTRRGVSSIAWGVRKVYRGAFLIRGGRTAMHRLGKARLPIEPVWGPRITREFARQGVDDELTQLVATKFPSTFKHELDFVLGRVGLGVK